MKVSVIVTSYNSSAHIARLLDSLLGQEGRGRDFELEIIVVDDCSTDNTLEILAGYPEVRVLQTAENSGGPNRGRNMGLELCTGDVVCIADHDDEWHSNRLIRQLDYIEMAPIVSCGYTVVDEAEMQEQVRSCESDTGHRSFEQNETFVHRLRRDSYGQNTYLGSLMFRGNLRYIHFEERFGAVDYDWVLRLFEHRPSIEICESLYRRYVFGSNLSLNEGYRQKDFRHSLDFIEQYREDYPDEVKLGARRIYGSLARYYYLMDRMPEARRHFLRSEWSMKTLLYWLTTWVGGSFVRKHFNVFG